jgi:hypothetical protein
VEARARWLAIVVATACGGGRHAGTDAHDRIDGTAGDAATDASANACVVGSGTGCYAITCSTTARSLQANRDRLIADLARRRCADSCAMWAALSQAERYIFEMDTAYLGASSSRLYPTAMTNVETALDHAVALYTINAPNGSNLGGLDYNRIYLGFDALAECVMRDFAIANPTMDPSGNLWVKSDDIAGPHAPFTQREMIFWYKAAFDPQSEGPQFHLWHQDSDFSQSGLDQRLGVCGVTDRSIVELTIAYDFTHNSDPLGNYATRGGYGWQIVDQHVGIPADWSYTPTGCSPTPPVNTDQYGGGTFGGMGPKLVNGACVAPAPLGHAGC